MNHYTKGRELYNMGKSCPPKADKALRAGWEDAREDNQKQLNDYHEGNLPELRNNKKRELV